jgi:hypothetical protein
MRGDLPGRQALGAQRDHHRIDALQAALAFADRGRLEGALPVPGHVDLDRADLGEHGLGASAVAGVAANAALRSVTLVAEMLAHLDLQAGLEDPAGDVGQ